MRIVELKHQYGNDFAAWMECEHCGAREYLNTGYHDARYHYQVIPAMRCGACGLNRAGEPLVAA
jgi:hypothetical protein